MNDLHYNIYPDYYYCLFYFNTVAFYELFNEPTRFRGLPGNMSRNEWKEINENIIDLIRAYDKKTIPLVVGFDWAYDLNFLHYDPVNAEGIAYVTHPYLMKRSRPWEAKWEENFGFAADRHPRMIESWDTYKLTGCGAFFKEALHGKVGN